MRMSFFWKENEVCKGFNCLVNWNQVCALKASGGMSVIDLTCQNATLLTKWIWTIVKKPDGLWASTVAELYGCKANNILGKSSSFFMNDLTNLMSFFNSSIRQGDHNKWRWMESGAFTYASAYKMMHNEWILCPFQKYLWKLKAPIKVKVFVWIMLKNKILTQEVMAYRGCTVQQGCQLCGSNRLEIRNHILWSCAYAIKFWTQLLAEFEINFRGGKNITQVWKKGKRGLQTMAKVQWGAIWAVRLWAPWRERNRRTFAENRWEEERLI